MEFITVGQAVLSRVVAELGGIETAAARLRLPRHVLNGFVDGTVAVPDIILLRAVDIVLEDQQQAAPPVVTLGSSPASASARAR